MPQTGTKKILHLDHVSIIVQKIKAWAKATFALISHTHAMDDITDLDGAIGTINERVNNIEQSADEVLPFGGFVQVAQKDIKSNSPTAGGAGFIAFNETTQRFIYVLTAKASTPGQPPTVLLRPEYYGGFMGVGTYNDGGAEGYPFPDKLYLYQDRTYVFDKHSLVPTDNKPYVVEIEMKEDIPGDYTLGTIDPAMNLQDVFNGTSGNLVYDTENDAIYFVAGNTYYEQFPGKELVCQNNGQSSRPRRDVIYKWGGELDFYDGGEMNKLTSDYDLRYTPESMVMLCQTAAGTAAKKCQPIAGKNGDGDLARGVKVVFGTVVHVFSSVTNTAKNPTLEIGDSGACPIYYAGAAITTANLDKAGKAGWIQTYVFFEDKWHWMSWNQDTNTTYTAMTYNGTNGHLDTGTSTTGMVISPKTLKSFVEDKVNEKVSTVYRPMGSCSSSYLKNLPLTQKTGDEWALPNGSVYNITDELTTDDNFVEGAGKTYPAGTNVVLVEPSEGVRKWDVLAGSVDLSGYVNKSEFLDELMGNVNSGKIVNDVYIEGNDVKVQLQTNTSVQYQPHTLFSFATDTEVGDAVQTELNKN